MKKVKFSLLFAAICIAQACSNSSTTKDKTANDTTTTMTEAPMTTHTDTATTAAAAAPAAPSTPVDKKSADFAMEAAQGGMMEVQLGSYAQQNALSERVKAFGAMMVRDHSKANDELKSIATTKSITLPADMSDSKEKKEMNELMKKTGKDFDKAYMKMMVEDHKKDVKAFEDASKDVKDTELKNFASSTLPVLKVHLDSAKAIAGKY